jgi:hypothetical protein
MNNLIICHYGALPKASSPGNLSYYQGRCGAKNLLGCLRECYIKVLGLD